MLLGQANRLSIRVPGEDTVVGVDWSVFDTVRAWRFTSEPAFERRPEGEQVLTRAFTVLDSVGLLLPRVPVRLASGKTMTTNQAAVYVNFPPADTLQTSYRSIDREPKRWSDFGLYFLLAGLVLLTLLGWLLYARSRRTPAPVEAAPPPSAGALALAALERLRTEGEGLDEAGYYARLDRILRAYLEARYAVPALRSTSREVMLQLQAQAGAHAPKALEQMLSGVDYVKFGRAPRTGEQRRTDLEAVRGFVRDSEARVLAQAPTETPSDGD